MKTLTIFIAGTLVVILGALMVFFEVHETEYAIVKLFGNPWRTLREPGLKMKWPWPIEVVERIDKRVKVTDITDTSSGATLQESEYLTKDKKNVLVNFFVVWRVDDPLQFLVSVNDVRGAESRLGDILRSEMGAELGMYELGEIVSTGKIEKAREGGDEAADFSVQPVAPPGTTKIPEIMDRITRRAAETTRRDFGIEILGVRMKRLNFPRQNKQAVFERMEAERERIAVGYRSEGEEKATKLKAEADRRNAELVNTAERKAEEIKGQADAEATRIYAEAYALDPEFYEFYKMLETYEAIMNEDDIIVIPSDSPLLKLLKEGK